ncbi:MAG: VCBS repeat-containing protein [Chloroflexi bacterium]|nr:VCBS repeat-containing protein [Chloroflexota bacterium]
MADAKHRTRKWVWRISILGTMLVMVLGLAAVGLFVWRFGLSGENVVASEANPTQLDWSWQHLSTTRGDIPAPTTTGHKQTAALILDIDLDGINDFVIGTEEAAPCLVWYQRQSTGWTVYLIDNDALPIEAGGTYADIDLDGDPDIVMGAGSQSNEVWWWENPAPNFDPDMPWSRYLIKNTGGPKHHDQIFVDYDGDGREELVFWNQRAELMLAAEIPDNPRQPWSLTEIYSWADRPEITGLARDEGLEGLDRADIDGDGVEDILGGGRWFRYESDGSFSVEVIDNGQGFARATAGQLIPGGRPEVVMGCGDCIGPLKWYEWTGTAWVGHALLDRDIDFGHSLDIVDINGDGHLDIFVGEMRLRSQDDNPHAKLLVLLGDSQGNFETVEIATDFGNHQSQVGDLDGDGDLDILSKPFKWDTPRVDIWLDGGGTNLAAEAWDSRVLGTNDDRMVFVVPADLNGDNYPDVVAGDAWFENPQTPDGEWTQRELPTLGQVAVAYDFDGDADIDLFGTKGEGSADNSELVWLENQGTGAEWVAYDVDSLGGNFLQGALTVDLDADERVEVVLSWHDESQGVHVLQIPADPTQPWTIRQLSATSLGEELNVGDIDGDGDLDLLLGTQWLANPGSLTGTWTVHTIGDTDGSPDRNALVDINGDGALDAVTGNEELPTDLYWFQSPDDPAQAWTRYSIATNLGGVYSMDTADMDGDGDIDIILGEHKQGQRLLLFENVEQGSAWVQVVIDTGADELDHHDGTQLVDIDLDGDLDIVSIGWNHNNVLLFTNQVQ